MENTRQLIRYLTIGDILFIAEDHVGGYQLLNENQLHYLVEAVGGRFGDTEMYPTLFQKAAVYAHHIITGHIFLDGNACGHALCTLIFTLERLFSSSRHYDSIIDLGFKIADGTITDIDVIADHIQSWIL